MELTEAIKKRYSCRSYSSKKISKEQVLELLELANQAPSASNKQNREFIVITSEENRKWLANMNNQPYLGEAPVVILAVTKLNKETTSDYLKDLVDWEMTINGIKPNEFTATQAFEQVLQEMRYKWMICDVAAAVENLLLAATDKGLVSCWIGIMDFQGIVTRFGLPNDAVPICLVTLGYEKQPPQGRAKRKSITELVHWEKY